mmetsp:Transcript_127002/g.353708  ORF Transcript_127002/g.353708 Transcript_127002/m.353708 type:complete len:231 (-) Transcript_127002:1828-2520(-)
MCSTMAPGNVTRFRLVAAVNVRWTLLHKAAAQGPRLRSDLSGRVSLVQSTGVIQSIRTHVACPLPEAISPASGLNVPLLVRSMRTLPSKRTDQRSGGKTRLDAHPCGPESTANQLADKLQLELRRSARLSVKNMLATPTTMQAMMSAPEAAWCRTLRGPGAFCPLQCLASCHAQAPGTMPMMIATLSAPLTTFTTPRSSTARATAATPSTMAVAAERVAPGSIVTLVWAQ